MRREDSLKTKIIWVIFVVCASFVLCLSLFHIANMSGRELIQWGTLVLLTLFVGSHSIPIPGSKVSMSVSDTFIFTTVLLHGPYPATILACFDGYIASRKLTNRTSSIVYSASVMGVSIFVSAQVFEYVLSKYNLGRATDLALPELILPLCFLALTHYLLNTFGIGCLAAFRHNLPIFYVWKDNFLLASLTYFAGAAAAALLYFAIQSSDIKWSFPTLILVAPILIFVYLSLKITYEKVEEKNRHLAELTRLHLSIIETLAVAIDAKDQTTHGHVRRVQTYAVGLGEIFGLSGGDMEALKAAALLHDVGKLAVPDYILNKPHSLTDAEFAKMKIHAVVGGEMLKGVGFPYPVDVLVRCHHEWWDGSGYPDGLKGEQIPLGGRILAVVDFYDAVRCDRPYRKGMTREKAIELLKEGRGTHFDPNIVDAFIEHLPEFEERIAHLFIPEIEVEQIKAAAVDAAVQAQVVPTRREPIPPSVLDTIASAQREVFALYEISQTFTRSLNLKDMMAVIASKLENIVPFSTCVINLLDSNTGMINAKYVVGINAELFKDRKFKPGTGVTGWVVANCRPMYNTNPNLDFSENERELARQYKGIAVFPLIKGEDVIGTISLYSTEISEYSQDHIRLMELVSQQASDAINNSIAYEQAKESALTDLLTGLLNSRAFYLYLEQELATARKLNHPLTILNMDLDGFKKVNDTFGHQVGDRILAQVGQVLRRQFREADILTRYAGDEFMAILPTIDRRNAAVLTDRIQHAIDVFEYRLRNGQTITIGISVGVASYPDDGDTIEELMAKADKRMYENKRMRHGLSRSSRRGEVIRFNPHR